MVYSNKTCFILPATRFNINLIYVHILLPAEDEDEDDDLCDNGDDDNWSSFNQNNYSGNFVRSTSYIFLDTIVEETSDDLRSDSERSSEEGKSCTYYFYLIDFFFKYIFYLFKSKIFFN